MAITIEEQIQKKSSLMNKWREENPGREWSEAGKDQDEAKIYFPRKMLTSKTYLSLSRASLLVFGVFMLKRDMQKSGGRKKTWKCANNGEIVFPYSEALALGFSRTQFRNAIDELQQKGFIDITHAGRGGRAPENGHGDYTTYWVDDRWEWYGTDDFEPARGPRKKDARKDRGFAAYWKQQKNVSIKNDTPNPGNENRKRYTIDLKLKAVNS